MLAFLSGAEASARTLRCFGGLSRCLLQGTLECPWLGSGSMTHTECAQERVQGGSARWCNNRVKHNHC